MTTLLKDSPKAVEDLSSRHTPVYDRSFERYPRVLSAIETCSDMAALVEKHTGWEIDLSSLTIEIKTKHSALREAFADELSVLPISDEELRQAVNDKIGPDSKAREQLKTFALGTSGLAVFLPNSNKIIFIAENVYRASDDAIKQTLYHELIHVGQKQNTGFVDALHSAYIDYKEAERKGDKAALVEARDTWHARMSFIEGHPSYYEELHKDENFPDVKLNPILSQAIGAVLGLLSPEYIRMSLHYSRGRRIFETLAAERPDLIEAMYQNPSLVDAALKNRGDVLVKAPDFISQEDFDSFVDDVEYLDSIANRRKRPAVLIYNDEYEAVLG